MRLVEHVMDIVIPNVFEQGALQRYGQTQERVVNVLSVLGQWIVMNVALHVRDG